MFLLLASLVLPVLAAPPKTKDIVIEGYLDSCTGECTVLCMVTSDGSLYAPIEGLPFAWGRRKTVRVAVRHIEDPP